MILKVLGEHSHVHITHLLSLTTNFTRRLLVTVAQHSETTLNPSLLNIFPKYSGFSGWFFDILMLYPLLDNPRFTPAIYSCIFFACFLFCCCVLLLFWLICLLVGFSLHLLVHLLRESNQTKQYRSLITSIINNFCTLTDALSSMLSSPWTPCWQWVSTTGILLVATTWLVKQKSIWKIDFTANIGLPVDYRKLTPRK